MSENTREERAFEALFVSSMRRVDNEDVDIDRIRESSEKEKAALDLLGPDFIDEVIAGKRPALDRPESDENCDRELALAGESVGGELFRAGDIDEDTARELDEKDRGMIAAAVLVLGTPWMWATLLTSATITAGVTALVAAAIVGNSYEEELHAKEQEQASMRRAFAGIVPAPRELPSWVRDAELYDIRRDRNPNPTNGNRYLVSGKLLGSWFKSSKTPLAYLIAESVMDNVAQVVAKLDVKRDGLFFVQCALGESRDGQRYRLFVVQASDSRAQPFDEGASLGQVTRWQSKHYIRSHLVWFKENDGEDGFSADRNESLEPVELAVHPGDTILAGDMNHTIQGISRRDGFLVVLMRHGGPDAPWEVQHFGHPFGVHLPIARNKPFEVICTFDFDDGISGEYELRTFVVEARDVSPFKDWETKLHELPEIDKAGKPLAWTVKTYFTVVRTYNPS